MSHQYVYHSRLFPEVKGHSAVFQVPHSKDLPGRGTKGDETQVHPGTVQGHHGGLWEREAPITFTHRTPSIYNPVSLVFIVTLEHTSEAASTKTFIPTHTQVLFL